MNTDALHCCSIIGKFKNGFLLIENDKGIYIIDQHAADERVQLEKICDDPLKATDEEKMMACMSACKITETVDMKKSEKMICALSETAFPYICAHGRPTIINILKK